MLSVLFLNWKLNWSDKKQNITQYFSIQIKEPPNQEIHKMEEGSMEIGMVNVLLSCEKRTVTTAAVQEASIISILWGLKYGLSCR